MLHRSPLPSPAVYGRSAAWSVPLLGAALFLAGCAQVPDLGSLPALRAADSWAVQQSLNAQTAAWPVQAWWKAYGDAQLDALVQEALAGSPDLQVAAARLQRASALVDITASTSRPQLSAQASASADKLSYHHLTPRAMLPSGFNDYGRASLGLQWELDFWGKNRAALAAATSDVQASQAELAQARLVLASAVASQYAELSRLFANRDTAAKAVEVRQKTAHLLTQRVDNGLENRGAPLHADARRALAEEQLLATDERIALQRHRLAALLGAGPDRGLSIERPTLPWQQRFGLPDNLAADLLGRRPDVVAARWRAQAEARRIDLRKAEFYPNVNLSAMVGLQALGLDMLAKGGSSIAAAGPAISLPIFSAGRLEGALRGQHASYTQAVAQYDAAVTRALQEVADNAVSQKAVAERLHKAQEAAQAATQAHQVARSRYEGGLATYLEVLSAEDGLLHALQVQTDLRSASVSLDIALQRALGGGYGQPESAIAAR